MTTMTESDLDSIRNSCDVYELVVEMFWTFVNLFLFVQGLCEKAGDHTVEDLEWSSEMLEEKHRSSDHQPL